MLAAWCILFGIALVYGDAVNEVEHRIVNSEAASPGEFPYQVSLQAHGRLHCGGIIVDEYHVITAGHCIKEQNYNYGPDDLTVVLGTVDLSSHSNPGTKYRVTDLRLHELYHYRDGWPNDIAILKLASSIPFNEYVQPAKLPKIGDVLRRNQKATISGFGKFSSKEAPSPILYKTQVYIESNKNCRRAYPNDPIRETNICTYQNKVTGFCNGDSGGPLTVDGKVVGLVSFSLGYGCGDAGIYPQVYTRISNYITWIEHWLKYL